MENGTVWSNSSESSDDSSSPALAHHAHRLAASNMLQTNLTPQLSFTPHKSSASTPSLSSNQEEDETEAGEAFAPADALPNGHLQTSRSHSPDCAVADRVSVQSADLSESSAELSCSCPDVCPGPPALLIQAQDFSESGVPQVCILAVEKRELSEDLSVKAGQTEAETQESAAGAAESVQESRPPEEALTVSVIHPKLL